MKKLKFILPMLILCIGIFMTGCGKKEDVKKDIKQDSETEKKEEEEQKEVYITIGNKSEEAYNIYVTNHTGRGITQVMFKTSDKAEYPSNMMKADEVWPDNETAEIFYIPESMAVKDGEDVKKEAASGKSLNIVYNVKFVLDDGSEFELSSLGIEDIDKDVELCFEDNVGFVKYVSKNTKAEVSTKEQEIGARAKRG